jgi:polysaccharide export outer membrane protein
MRVRSKSVARCFLLSAGVLSLSGGAALAQYAGQAVASPPHPASAPASAMHASFEDIKIMPDDVIAILTLAAPELTTSSGATAASIVPGGGSSATGLKVDSRGQIQLPYLGTVKVAGMTPSEVATYLADALKERGILVDPQVSVELMQSPSRVITVIGEVQRPAPLPFFGQLRLLEAISACGGFTSLASHAITVQRLGVADPIAVELGADAKAAGLSDIPLLPGDTIIVPKVGNVFVVGQVKNQMALPVGGNTPITVVRAIALPGGLNYGAALSKSRIIRTTADGRHIEIMLDLHKVLYGKQQDVALASDDVLFIPSNTFKATVAAGGLSVAAALAYESTYVATSAR